MPDQSVEVYFIIDDSGSMNSYHRVVRTAIKSITSISRDTLDFSYRYRYVGFSGSAVSCDDIDSLPLLGGSTNIERAFQLLNSKIESSLKSTPTAAALQPSQTSGNFLEPKIIIVFISDGMDDNPSTINERLKALNEFKANKTLVLFTVAVGDGFPTGMVVDALRPMYHTASDSLPLVFPVTAPENTMGAFEHLATYLFKRDHCKELLHFDEHASLSELTDGIDDVYNYYMIKCAQNTDADKNLEYLNLARHTLMEMSALAVRLEKKELGQAAEGANGDSNKHLTSSILARKQKQRCRTLITDALTRINQYIDSTVKGCLLAKLSDADKQKLLSYGNVAGKHLTKSLRYHSADLGETIRSLVDCLREYDEDQAAADALVSDGTITQKEALLDAQGCIDALADSAGSLVGVLEALPVVGRLLQIKTCSGTQINPFLVEVVGLPAILQMSNTTDFFTLYQGAYESRGESANCLMPVTLNRSPKGLLRRACGAHIATYLLCRNAELRFPTALLALQAAVVTHCLERRSAWLDGVLDETYASFRCVYDPSLNRPLRAYLDLVAGADFRLALVTQSDALPAECTCEHLTKFVLAVYVLVREGRGFSEDELLERMKAAMVEMVGRSASASGRRLLDSFAAVPLRDAAALLGRVPRAAALAAYTEAAAVREFQGRVEAAVRADRPECGIARVDGPDDIREAYFQFSRPALSRVFASLSRLAGHGVGGAGRFDVPDRGERLALLQQGFVAGSHARHAAPGPPPPFDEAAVQAVLVQRHVRAVRDGAAAFIGELYRAQQRETHRVVWPCPPAYLARYLADTGRDAAADFSVSPHTWLPRRACASPDCPHFLARRAAAVTSAGEPRVSDEVWGHLEGHRPVPGLHRCVRARAGEPADAIDAVVRAGAHLLPSGDALAGKVAQIGRAVELHGFGDGGGRGAVGGLVFRQHIARIQESYARIEELWSYDEFRRRFDDAYEREAAAAASAAAEEAAAAETGSVAAVPVEWPVQDEE